eukprot:SAG31_NODE_1349_length_8691_cov_6.407239_4_plen_109_part_00
MNASECSHVHIIYQQATALIGCGDNQISLRKGPLHGENPAVFDGWRRAETLKVAIGIGLPNGASRALHTVLGSGAQVSSFGFCMRLHASHTSPLMILVATAVLVFATA